jgi:hypothetical protein
MAGQRRDRESKPVLKRFCGGTRPEDEKMRASWANCAETDKTYNGFLFLN